MSSKDVFGDRLKAYETLTETTISTDQGVVVRVDGRSFHTFTRPLNRVSTEDGLDGWPNVQFSLCMQDAAQEVAKDFRPDIFYVQSDEVTFAWFPLSGPSEFPFGGRVQKLASLCAAKMSVCFYEHAKLMLPQLFERKNQYPIFDGRCFAVPNAAEVANAVLWRMFDSEKNAIQTIARKRFGQAGISGRPNKELRELLFPLNPNVVRSEESDRLFYEHTKWFIEGVGETFLRGIVPLFLKTDVFRLHGLDSKRYWEYITSSFPEHFPERTDNDESGNL